MENYTHLVEHLAVQIRDFPRKGVKRPNGMLILQRGKKRLPHDPTGWVWEKDTSVPTDVASWLLGIKFDDKSVYSSCLIASEVITRKLGLSLSYADDFILGAYLLSCLVKAGYYEFYELFQNKGKYQYALRCVNKSVLALNEIDDYTQDHSFPPWNNFLDEEGRRLIIPSSPQRKETFCKPVEGSFYEKSLIEGAQFSDTFSGNIGSALIASDMQGYLNIWSSGDGVTNIVSKMRVAPWIKAVNKLEQVKYSINEDILFLINESPQFAPPRKHDSLEREYRALKKEKERIQKGARWEFLEKKNRTIAYLVYLSTEYPEKLTSDQLDLLSVFNKKWICNQKARRLVKTNYREFLRIKKHIEILRGKPFYHRVTCDYQGRININNSIVNYQGCDLLRGLIDFSEGKKIRLGDWKHLWIHLANTYGLTGDAITKEKQAKCKSREFLKWAQYPIETFDQWYSEASSPWQFIRACMELLALKRNPDHKSALIVAIDHSTSYLQHVSMISGDEKLASRVNLAKNYNDIYQDLSNALDDFSEITARDRRKIVKTAYLAWSEDHNSYSVFESLNSLESDYIISKNSAERMLLAGRVTRHIEESLNVSNNFIDPLSSKIIKDYGKKSEGGRESQVNAVWETASRFCVHLYKQKLVPEEEATRAHLYRNSSDNDTEESIRLEHRQPSKNTNVSDLEKTLPHSFIHSIDASVTHLLIANAPEEQQFVAVGDVIGCHIRHATNGHSLFKHWFCKVYEQFHPLQVAVEGIASVLENGHRRMPDSLIEMVKKARHMT